MAPRVTERIGQTVHGYVGEQARLTGYGQDRRVLHACERCGFVRVVKYTPRLRDGVEVGGSVRAECRACDLEQNAAKYERLAAVNRKRAAEERTRQALRRLAPYRT